RLLAACPERAPAMRSGARGAAIDGWRLLGSRRARHTGVAGGLVEPCRAYDTIWRAPVSRKPSMLDPQEHRGRISRLTRLMRQQSVDGAIFTAESNISYFSGFRSHAPWMTSARPNFMVVSASGQTALLGSGFVEPEMKRMSIVSDV